MKKIRRMALVTAAAAAALVGAVLVPAPAEALGQYQPGRTGIDISYPSCDQPVPRNEPFGIVGVSGGRVYTDNSCAAAEAAKFSNVSIYVNTGLNTAGSYFSQAMAYGKCAVGDRSCGAYWYGYLAGVHAYKYAVSQKLQGARTWWLDVEVMNTWNDHTALNDRSILGEHQALADETRATATKPKAVIGVYARSGEWSTITGGRLAAHKWPVWYATGLRHQTSKQLAGYCTRSFTASKVQIVQWIGKGFLNDLDYGC
jgi:hypothetical protein